MSEQNKAVVRRIIEDYWNKKNPALAGRTVRCRLCLPYPGRKSPKRSARRGATLRRLCSLVPGFSFDD